MPQLTSAEREAAELVRLERAVERFADYTLTPKPNAPGVFLVEGGSRPYTTAAHYCDCPDAQYRGVACVHQQLVRGRLLADGPQDTQARRAQAQADRALWD